MPFAPLLGFEREDSLGSKRSQQWPGVCLHQEAIISSDDEDMSRERPEEGRAEEKGQDRQQENLMDCHTKQDHQSLGKWQLLRMMLKS